MRDDRRRLLDILEAIEAIDRYATLGRAVFDSDELVQVWMVHHLRIIGEAVRTLSPEVRERRKDIPWSQIISMRNILIHSYFGVDPEQVWSAAATDVPVLRPAIQSLLADLDHFSGGAS